MPNPSQEPRASYKTPNQDIKTLDVLCIFKSNRINLASLYKLASSYKLVEFV